MYEKIRSRKSVPALYEERLIVCLPFLPLGLAYPHEINPQLDDVITPADAQAVRDAERVRLDTGLAQVDTHIPLAPMLQGQWIDIVWPADEKADRDPPTGVVRTVLENIGRASVTVPSDFVRESLPK